MGKQYILPDYTTTKDPQVYADAWTSLAEPFEALGYRLVAVDPSIQIAKGGAVFNIPRDVAMRMVELEKSYA